MKCFPIDLIKRSEEGGLRCDIYHLFAKKLIVLSRRPGQLSPAQDVDMNVVDGLTAFLSVVDDDPENMENIK